MDNLYHWARALDKVESKHKVTAAVAREWLTGYMMAYMRVTTHESHYLLALERAMELIDAHKSTDNTEGD